MPELHHLARPRAVSTIEIPLNLPSFRRRHLTFLLLLPLNAVAAGFLVDPITGTAPLGHSYLLW